MALSPMLSTLYVLFFSLCSGLLVGVFMKLELYDAQWNSDKFSELEFRNRCRHERSTLLQSTLPARGAVDCLFLKSCIKTGKPQTAKRAIEQVEQRLLKDGWPEYYDDKAGRYVRKQERKYQTWSISGYLVAKLMIENPANLSLIPLEEDKKIAKPRLTRSASF
ncbi:unnamed protein product [Prunus brigantina]